jgi:WD40 repeat protein
MDRTVRLWDVEGGKQKKELGKTEDDLYGLAFARDGKSFATSGYAGWLKVWKLDADKPIFSQKLKAFGAYCVVFTPDGKSLVTGHDNRSIIITPIGK